MSLADWRAHFAIAARLDTEIEKRIKLWEECESPIDFLACGIAGVHPAKRFTWMGKAASDRYGPFTRMGKAALDWDGRRAMELHIALLLGRTARIVCNYLRPGTCVWFFHPDRTKLLNPRLSLVARLVALTADEIKLTQRFIDKDTTDAQFNLYMRDREIPFGRNPDYRPFAAVDYMSLYPTSAQSAAGSHSSR